jgi:Sulfotransferase family
MSAADIRQQIGRDTWDSYFKFTVIRDPFDKMVSGYFFSEKPQGSEQQLVDGFRDWVRNGGEIIDRHTYTIGGDICMDYFIRYEALEQGIQHVCNELSIPFSADQLPQLKTGFRQREVPLSAFYDAHTRTLVEAKFAFELEQFGYNAPV